MLRPPEEDDFEDLLELMNAHQLAAFGEADVPRDELESWLTSPSVEVERDIRVLERDGRLLGYADVDGPMVDPMWRASWDFAAEAAVAQQVRGA